VEYKVLGNNQLKEKQNHEINQVSAILGKNKHIIQDGNIF
jgi:hypothetical protein